MSLEIKLYAAPHLNGLNNGQNILYIFYGGNPPGNLPAGFQVKELETRQWGSRLKAGNPTLVRFQKAANPPVGF